ncbi:MAG TPA: hypothetical protein VJP77_01335, partial [Planctomycetota bacterium]|nr:hypothetical protein [Planctomycetota bacterium]
MSESTTLAAPGERRGTAVAEPAEARVYSKDYWDIVFEQLARRKLFKIGLAVLALLYAVAIYAPLIANDKPYSIEAIDFGEYRNAARSISAVGSSLARKLGQTEAEYAEQLAALDAER